MAKMRDISGITEVQVLDSSEMQKLALANSKTDFLIKSGNFDTLTDCIIADQNRDHSNGSIATIFARQYLRKSVRQPNLKIANEIDEGLGKNIVPGLSEIIADYVISVPVVYAKDDASIIGDSEYAGKGEDFDPADG